MAQAPRPVGYPFGNASVAARLAALPATACASATALTTESGTFDGFRAWPATPDASLGTAVLVHGLPEFASCWEPVAAGLLAYEELPIEDVLALDRVQKHMPIDAETAARLRNSRLVEGRRPNLRVAPTIADVTDTRAEYIRVRGQTDVFYQKQIRDYLEEFESAIRAEMNTLLLPQLSDSLTDRQKRDKVGNLLASLRKIGAIQNSGTRARLEWVLS